jgi:hypothetical protein
MKIMSKKVKFFGRTVPAVAIALIAIAALASAGLLSYYGMITGTATVSQSVLVDGKSYTEPITYTYSGVAGNTVVDGPHNLTNDADIPATVKFETTCCNSTTGQCGYETGAACEGITTTVTSTITESSSYADYASDSQRLVALKVSGLTLRDLLAKDLEYTVNVTSNPKYAPNINIWITDGTNTYVVQAWGKDWSGTGPHTVSFSGLVTLVAGYGATVNPALGAANTIKGTHATCYGSPEYCYYTSVSDLLADFGSATVVKVEVRAQAGAAGGQVIRPVTFKAAGVTIDVPDSDSITGNIILQPGELLNFYITNTFAINLVPDTYTITTGIVPVPS